MHQDFTVTCIHFYVATFTHLLFMMIASNRSAQFLSITDQLLCLIECVVSVICVDIYMFVYYLNINLSFCWACSFVNCTYTCMTYICHIFAVVLSCACITFCLIICVYNNRMKIGFTCLHCKEFCICVCSHYQTAGVLLAAAPLPVTGFCLSC